MPSLLTLPRSQRLYLVVCVLFSVVVVLSNLITIKLFQIPALTEAAVPAGIVTYPLTFILVDMIAEVYGQRHAKFMVYLGLGAGAVTYGIIALAIALPPHHLWSLPLLDGTTNQQRVFEAIFGLNGLIVGSSLVAYLLGQLVDVRLFFLLKRLTRGRYLWLRNNVSTLASQLIDTMLVTGAFLGWGLKMHPSAVLSVVFVSYSYKALLTIAGTPLFYCAVRYATRYINHTPPSHAAC